jgi:hypothetical protein
MRKKQLIRAKPAYYRGQLLLEDDFIAEQRYHRSARYRHSLNLHGWGIVRGFEVMPEGDGAVRVNPGYAIDRRGHEIETQQAEVLEVSTFSPNALVTIALSYEEERPSKTRDQDRRIQCYGVLKAAVGSEDADNVILATVQLDERAKVTQTSISTSNAHYLRTLLTPGSVTASSLDARLRKGWYRVPVRADPLERDPVARDEELPPPFRAGATQASSYETYEGKPNTRGAGGTMTIPVLPSVTAVHRLRIAGVENESRMQVLLFAGGWDAAGRKHRRRTLIDKEVRGRPYDETFEISDSRLDPECDTLSLRLRAYGKCTVSLVAVEFSY